MPLQSFVLWQNSFDITVYSGTVQIFRAQRLGESEEHVR